MATAFELIKKKPTTSVASTEPASAFESLKKKPTSQFVEQSEIVADKKENIASRIFRGATEPVVTLLARPFQAAEDVYSYIKDPTKTPDLDINLPYYGTIKAPETGKDIIKDIGRGIETVTLGVGGGAGAGIKALGKMGTKELVKRGSILGAKTGAAFGAGAGLENEATIGGALKGAATGAVSGAAFGAVAPLAGKAVGSAIGRARSSFAGRAVQKAEQVNLLKNKIPDTSIATKTLSKEGKLITDRVAKEAVKQGIPEADVSLIKLSSNPDKIKMSKMLDVRERGITNKRYAAVNRSTDVVGDTFVEKIAKPIDLLVKDAGKKLDAYSAALNGKKINPANAVLEFGKSLNSLGIRIGKNGKLSYKNSAFEGLGSIQSNINNVWTRALRIAKTGDALQSHRAKTFIDQMVEYGAEGTGLKGKASVLLKQFRHNLDLELDTRFPTYNKINTQFADGMSMLQKIAESVGKKSFRLNDAFVDANTGTAMRRLFSNTQSRTKILGMLEESQKMLAKYGIKVKEDIINQAAFADSLEKILGTEAPTSILGQFSKGLETFGSTSGIEGLQQVGSAASEIARGNIVRGVLKIGTQSIDTLRGINQKNAIKALRSLLNTKQRTNFGVTK